MATPDLKYAIGLPPEKAIEYFEAKGYAIGFRWQDVWAEAHAQAFTVAGVLKQDVLEDIRGAVSAALKKGETLADFQQRLQALLEQKGWWGTGQIVDKDSGEIVGKRLNARRLETIYRTNLRSAYMAGQYQSQLANAHKRPWWKYVAVLDRRTRPRHRAMSGRVFRYDDPFWLTFYPPNGYRCRCDVVTYSDGALEARGLTPSNSAGRLESVEQLVNRQGETRPTTGYRDPATGELFTADPGFGFNAGHAALFKLAQVLMERGAVASPRLAAMAVGEALAHPKVLQAVTANTRRMVQTVAASRQARGELLHVGALTRPVLDALEQRTLLPASGVLSVRDEDVLHAMRDGKEQALPLAFWETLPQQLRQPRAILLDRSQARPALLYVFDAPDGKGKLVVVLDYEVKVRNPETGKKERVTTNLIRTGRVVHQVETLTHEPAYEVLWGEV
ncbi:phage head morphogenesis protein [Crenobacter luteus]|uniref:Phage head morphogenesis domain-containing protein n=1 Tax=Crenobacter luteus TaxID=1452487 RepID=A0A165FTQ7_9NEIS|nr:phage minor head protein [Crenobacter luteus]KZE34172.1 hypothetical protein AVW16_06770 [Crenobacter luteus]